jgi:signal transduction histidine kinase
VNAELRDRERVRQQLLRKVISAQEDERKRLARELHDETTQTVTALGMHLELALSAPPERRARELEEARALAGRSLDELRRLMHDLRPAVLDDLGLVPALRWYAQRHLESRGVAVRFEVGALPSRLPYELETAIFRACQEALTNVARHADAEMVLVEIECHGDRLDIDIEDDGRGFDPETVQPSPGDMRGLGLLGMRERVELFGGSVRIDAAPGRGTHVAIRVPVTGGCEGRS